MGGGWREGRWEGGREGGRQREGERESSESAVPRHPAAELEVSYMPLKSALSPAALSDEASTFPLALINATNRLMGLNTWPLRVGDCGGLNLQRGVAPCKQQLGEKGSGRPGSGRREGVWASQSRDRSSSECRAQLWVFQGTAQGILMVPRKEEESLSRRQSHKSPSFLMRLPLLFAFFFFPLQ